MGDAHRIVTSETLEQVQCGGCMMNFAMPQEFRRQCLEEKRHFRCPNPKCEWGSQSFSETAVEKLERQLEEANARAARAASSRRWAAAQLDTERRSHRATRGHLTRARKRAGAGVCPCCNRSFKQLRRHMRSKHPEFEA